MSSFIMATILLVLLLLMIVIGRKLQRYLPDNHLSEDSKDALKLSMGLIGTMTALLLGLLVSSAKDTHDRKRTAVIQLAAKIALLNRVLVSYGPATSQVQTVFNENVTELVHQMWPEATIGTPTGMVDSNKGSRIYAELQDLSPQNEAQRGLKAQAVNLAMELAEIRMQLLAQMTPSIPSVLLLAVSLWLLIIFLFFSLLAPPNATTMMALSAAAIAVVMAVFLILELDRPLGGIIRISCEPILLALKQFS